MIPKKLGQNRVYMYILCELSPTFCINDKTFFFLIDEENNSKTSSVAINMPSSNLHQQHVTFNVYN